MSNSPTGRLPYVAMAGAAAMLAHQVAGKAARDAFFLSVFPAADLPRMVIAAAAAAVLLTVAISRLLARYGPRRVIPAGFMASAALHLVEWALVGGAQRTVAPLVYLHIVALGAVLLSGFWSLSNEVFDPRTAKQVFGRIAGAGTAGGIAGGLITERIAVWFAPGDVLGVLAAFHLICGTTLLFLRRRSERGEPRRETELLSPPEVFRRAPYFANLAVLILLGAAAAAMVDFLFKSGAAATFGKGAPLLRFLAIFYTVIPVVTLLIQTFLTRPALEKLGLSRTIGFLPAGLGAVTGIGLLFPAFPVFAFMRGVEYVLRGSLFRSGYELLYTPAPPAEKRAAKALIDVGCDRMGDAVGAGAVQILLVASGSFLTTELLGLILIAAFGAAVVASRLDRVYTQVIEQRLLDHAIELDPNDIYDSTTRSAVLRTGTLRQLRLAEPAPARTAPPAPAPTRAVSPAETDPVTAAFRRLRSGDATAVRAALAEEKLDPVLATQIVRLLAWDAVAADARRALERWGTQITGVLVDALTDPRQDFAIRRRVPRILARCLHQRAFDGLMEGLHDDRFEVRYQCARALDYLCQRQPQVTVPREAVLAAIDRELSVARPILETRRLLDSPDSDPAYAFLDSEISDRANKSAEQIFSLLALVAPREPLKVAYRAFHAEESYLRGLALEYLDSVLPAASREKMRVLFAEGEAPPAAAHTPEEIVEALMRSQENWKTPATGSGGGGEA